LDRKISQIEASRTAEQEIIETLPVLLCENSEKY
jgi:hypothetical protein